MSEYAAVSKSRLKLKTDSCIKKKKKSKDKEKILEKIAIEKHAEIQNFSDLKKCDSVPLTNAEKSFLKMKEKKQMKQILDKAKKTHKQRVEEFNRHLDSLTEHYDIPKMNIQRNQSRQTNIVEKVHLNCFSFHVVREYIVGNTQMSVIKVYDYYNPDATCTKFYSPGSSSPILRTICDGGICECAEGGCPDKNPFKDLDPTPQRREQLKTLFCESHEYVWKGKLNGRIRNDGGFLNISFTVEEVIKPGRESAIDIEGETRTLLARENCQVANLFPGSTYLILGKDGQQYMNDNGETWYRYLIDKKSVIYMWTSVNAAKDKKLQRDLNYVVRELKEKGCDL